MAHIDQSTTQWVAESLCKMDSVTDVVLLAPHALQINRKKYPTFVAAVISAPQVTPDILHAVLKETPSPDFVANVPKESCWTGAAIESVRGIGFGGIGDLMSAIHDENARAYVRPEYSFAERGLHQHSKVVSFEREFDRVYLVHRKNGLPALRFVMLNEYELTADHVRGARARYGHFDLIVASNPNGKPTDSAITVAESLGAPILMWGEFYSRLNKR